MAPLTRSATAKLASSQGVVPRLDRTRPSIFEVLPSNIIGRLLDFMAECPLEYYGFQCACHYTLLLFNANIKPMLEPLLEIEEGSGHSLARERWRQGLLQYTAETPEVNESDKVCNMHLVANKAALSTNHSTTLGVLDKLPPEILNDILDYMVERPLKYRGFSCVSHYALQLFNARLEPIVVPLLRSSPLTGEWPQLSFTGKLWRRIEDVRLMEMYKKEMDCCCYPAFIDEDDDL
ncbi:hypothetical protein K461DRAFT_296276 [Myriangium duriaei CBS 260.36]|uniref:Uncharacterized protein n=1 Tax=Myriangium duriaei CBS 260.36 TaxID=1168546 RepID=A0A9P4IW18_9PEZI|nr:hypothetical protein K461DRAFT_296276 [Myriangium duriaei CBS 260.36]